MKNIVQDQRLSREIDWHRKNVVPNALIKPILPEVIDRYRFLKNRNLFIKEFAISKMGNLKEKRVCDFGCGDGANSILLTKLGAYVEAFDLSPHLIEIALEKAKINHVNDRTNFVVSSVENYTCPDNYFDIVYGSAILHHLDIKKLHRDYFKKISRMLKDQGKAIFTEPISFSRTLSVLRGCVPVKADASPDERPLDRDDIEIIKRYFSKVEIKYFRLFGRLDRVLKNRTKIDKGHPFTKFFLKGLYLIDRLIIDKVPGIKKLSGDIVLICYK